MKTTKVVKILTKWTTQTNFLLPSSPPHPGLKHLPIKVKHTVVLAVLIQ